jgi:hypothetical protein
MLPGRLTCGTKKLLLLISPIPRCRFCRCVFFNHFLAPWGIFLFHSAVSCL